MGQLSLWVQYLIGWNVATLFLRLSGEKARVLLPLHVGDRVGR